jgi:hypothetical protein
MKYLQTIGIHAMFLNVATFSTTTYSLPIFYRKDQFFLTFLPDLLMTT